MAALRFEAVDDLVQNCSCIDLEFEKVAADPFVQGAPHQSRKCNFPVALFLEQFRLVWRGSHRVVDRYCRVGTNGRFSRPAAMHSLQLRQHH